MHKFCLSDWSFAARVNTALYAYATPCRGVPYCCAIAFLLLIVHINGLTDNGPILADHANIIFFDSDSVSVKH